MYASTCCSFPLDLQWYRSFGRGPADLASRLSRDNDKVPGHVLMGMRILMHLHANNDREGWFGAKSIIQRSIRGRLIFD